MFKKRRRAFALKEEYIFYTMLTISLLVMYLPIEFSKRNKKVDFALFNSIYNSWGEWAIKAALVLLGIISFYLAFRILKQYFIINNNPLSKIRSAAQGYVEVEGVQAFLPGKSLCSPLTKTPCTWYAYMVEELSSTGKGSHWVVKESGESSEHFMLVDTTGQCIISPDGADVFTRFYKVWIDPDNKRCTEQLLMPNEHVYVTGVFRTFSSSDINPESAEKNQKVLDLVKQWKQDYARLLQEFDVNKDGNLDKDEWDNVVRAAEKQINGQYPDSSSEDVVTVNIISKEGRKLDEPFIISDLRKKEILMKFHKKFVFYLVIFFVTIVAFCTVKTWYYHTLVKLYGSTPPIRGAFLSEPLSK